MLVGLRFLLGIGEGGAFPTATRAFTYWMPVAERGFAQGITHSFARLGGAVTPPSCLRSSRSRLARCVLAARRREPRVDRALDVLLHEYAGAASPHHAGGDGARSAIAAATAIAPQAAADAVAQDDRRMWLVTVVDFCYGWPLWVFLTWLPSYLPESRGFDLKQMALFTALPLLAGVVGDTLGGVVSDKLFQGDRPVSLRAAARCCVVGLGGALAFMLPTLSADSRAVTAVMSPVGVVLLPRDDECRCSGRCRSTSPASMRARRAA